MSSEARLLDAREVREDHRRMHHRLQSLHRSARRLPTADDSNARRDVARVVRFLDNEVLAHASAEEHVLQTSPPRGDALARARLFAYHDSIRVVRGLLADSDDTFAVRMPGRRAAGLLLGLPCGGRQGPGETCGCGSGSGDATGARAAPPPC